MDVGDAIKHLADVLRGSQSTYSMSGADAPFDIHVTVGFTEETLCVLERIADALEERG